MSTLQSNRPHISIFGEPNSGKSSLFNKLLDSNISIISEISGTTTDPVSKSMELIPFGPIVLIDTAGINDNTKLSKLRTDKTLDVINKTDIAIYVIDINNFDENIYNNIKNIFIEKNIPFIVVYTKSDLYNIKNYKKNLHFNELSISIKDNSSINILKNLIGNEINKIKNSNESLIKNLISPYSTIVLVVPIDSAAPKDRLILPQVQLIRDCLDNDIKCIVTTLKTLSSTLLENNNISLVITDSQVFKEVDNIVPKNIYLTSFSILMARKKGDLKLLIEGAKKIDQLKNNDNILIIEACTHAKTHEDIGQVKIPKLLLNKTKKSLHFHFLSGKEYPKNFEKYDLIIHCGACMITEKEMKNRIKDSYNNNIPITNYGIVIAYCNNILERSTEIMRNVLNEI